MPRGYRRIVLVALGWLILAASNPVFAKPGNGQEKSQPVGHQSDAAPLPSAGAKDDPREACVGAEQGNLSCDAIAAKAAYDQARDADWQTWVGIAGAIGVVASLMFSALATRAAFRAVTKAEETLDETKKMNAAIVRPIVAIESAWIDFDLHTYEPKIGLQTHNVSDFIAHDWEWQILLRYVERGSVLYPWQKRGVRGIDLPPQDIRDQIPKVISFPLQGDEIVAVTDLGPPGLAVKLTVFTRCYDTFGNVVDDQFHFLAAVYNLANPLNATTVYLESVPLGVRAEGQEDSVPEGSVT